MKKQILAVATALALAAASVATPAMARDRGHHGGYYGGGGGYYSHGYRHHHRRGDGDAALAAGVVGLVLGLAVGSAMSQPSQPRYAGCSDNYQRCAPPPDAYYDPRYDDRGYSEQNYAPAPDYPPPPPGYGEACIRQVEQWDPHSGRYVWVNLRTPC